MYFGVYRFEGEPASLLARYERLMAAFPVEQLLLHLCVQRPEGIEIYDACPTREAFDAFGASAQFRGALQAAGLPPPSVTRLGETSAVFAQGKRVA